MMNNNFNMTHSQEEHLWKEFHEGNLNIESLSFPNLSQEHFLQSGPILPEGYGEQEQQQIPPSMDEKGSLQPTIALMQMQQMQQPPLNPILGREEYAGPYNFELILYPDNTAKHWTHSQKLSKVFIHMEEVLPVQFRWTPPDDLLWIRATMVYKLDQHRSQPVTRCHNHMAPDNNSNRTIDSKQVRHVLRCSSHSTSTYEEGTNGHLSVLTPLGTPEAGLDNVPMDYKFFCKNSCNSGMNRRPTEVIFTLETDQNEILGRRKLEVRVCSCPKRDKEKEEKEYGFTSSPVIGHGKKRKMTAMVAQPPPPGKKLVVSDTKVHPLSLNIVGKDNYNAVVKYAYDLMAGAAMRTNNLEVFKPHMDEILRKSL